MTSGVKREGLRRIGVVVAALAVATAVFFLRRAGLLEGLTALLFALLLVLLLPFSSLLSRRILICGALLLGWIPVLWWVRLPVPDVDRAGIVLALLSGGMVGWVLWGHDVRSRARRLLPRVAVADGMPFVAAGIAVWTTWPFLASPGGGRSLNALMRMGWDQVGHVGMALMARAEGAIVPMLGRAPDGSPWSMGDYPQHFHATVTFLTELGSGPVMGDAATEVLRYGRSLALVQVLTAALLTAGVAQLPKFRRRPVLAWPFGALVLGAFIFGQGSWALSSGYPNFILACATAGLAILLAAPMSGESRPLRVFALGGLVVATVHGWVLLAPLAIVACALALVPLGRDRWPRTRRSWAKIIVAVVATGLASAAVIPILAGSGGVEALSTANDVLPPGLAKLSYLLRTGGVAFAVALAVYVRKETPDSVKKGLTLAGVSATAFLLVGLLGVYLYVTVGRFSYYFDKLLIGASLICVVALVAGVDLHVGPPAAPRGRVRKYVGVFASLVATVAALQMMGAEGLHARSRAIALTSEASPAAERVLQAAELSESKPFGSAVYVAAMPGDPRPILAHQWQRSLSLMWSYGSGVKSDYPDAGITLEQAAEWARALLQETPQRTVIVDPEIAESVRALLPSEMRSRVVTWEAQ